MNSKAIKRLENNHYALDKAYQRLKEAIGLNHNEEIYAATGETLLWVLTTDEWHKEHNTGYKRRKTNNENGQILFGLLHAYNSMKHNMDFMTIHEAEGGFEFPIEFPIEILPITVHWAITDELFPGERVTQEKNYKRYIRGREVVYIFDKVIKFLGLEYKIITR